MLDVRTDVAQILKTTCEAISRVSVPSLLLGDVSSHSVCTSLQAIHALKFDDPLAMMLHGIIVRHMLNAESVGPSCHSRFIQSLLKVLSQRTGGNQHLTSSGDIKDAQVTRTSCGATSDDLAWLLQHYANAGLINDAVTLAGPTGKVIIERSASSHCSIELVDGYTFNNVVFSWQYGHIASPLVVCVDGFIESVAEVNKLLTELAESHDRCILFVRGLVDEVKHTLRTNYDVGRLRVFPIVVPFELEGINTLNDVSVVAGCDLVTSIKGDLISSVGIHNASRVTSATCTRNSVMIVNGTTKHSVEQQSHTLSERIRSGGVNTAKMLEQRVRSLSPRTVVIRLPDNDAYVRTSQDIDYALRAVKSLVRYGVVGHGIDRELASSHFAVETCVAQCVNDIKNIGAALVSVE
jgi:hypothetical protein